MGSLSGINRHLGFISPGGKSHNTEQRVATENFSQPDALKKKTFFFFCSGKREVPRLMTELECCPMINRLFCKEDRVGEVSLVKSMY